MMSLSCWSSGWEKRWSVLKNYKSLRDVIRHPGVSTPTLGVEMTRSLSSPSLLEPSCKVSQLPWMCECNKDHWIKFLLSIKFLRGSGSTQFFQLEYSILIHSCRGKNSQNAEKSLFHSHNDKVQRCREKSVHNCTGIKFTSAGPYLYTLHYCQNPNSTKTQLNWIWG